MNLVFVPKESFVSMSFLAVFVFGSSSTFWPVYHIDNRCLSFPVYLGTLKQIFDVHVRIRKRVAAEDNSLGLLKLILRPFPYLLKIKIRHNLEECRRDDYQTLKAMGGLATEMPRCSGQSSRNFLVREE